MTDATSSGGHGHIHRESGPPQPDDKVHSYYQILGIALQELLIEKGIVSADEVRQMIERRDATTPPRCATLAARPGGLAVPAPSDNAPLAARADEQRRIYGVQFHPEVADTPEGAKLLANFARDIAGCAGDWTMAHFHSEAVAKIRDRVGAGKVICGLSGGVDSAVTAVLIHEAIGEQLSCIFVDHGLMRQNEGEQVVAMFRGAYNIPLVHVNARKRFISALDGVDDPEKKRKIIGGLFIDVFEEEAGKLGGAEFLAQGTLYPDVIESVSFTGGPSVTIKSHHNVGGLHEAMNLKLIEPLRELFKDEVRGVGQEMGLPKDVGGLQPVPGTCLATRTAGAPAAARGAGRRGRSGWAPAGSSLPGISPWPSCWTARTTACRRPTDARFRYDRR